MCLRAGPTCGCKAAADAWHVVLVAQAVEIGTKNSSGGKDALRCGRGACDGLSLQLSRHLLCKHVPVKPLAENLPVL